ncbi:hypothetical protein Patl1_18815 [Pistacia atlantica]|uniref:Uncharacterized protein n=1 Tax=Pistacia atlantica TaxID=434234 RepID=A0ACC1C2F3_9ROSI|nr:hypothetical protein Patl1_18815 [Pistacia atlantica]
MDKALTKASSFWISKKAKEELSNITQDLSSLSNTVEEKAKWIFNKLKGKPVKALPDLLRDHNLPPGTMSRGKLSGIEGMKTKVVVWVKVTNVAVESYKSDKVWFTAGVKKSRPKDAYDMPRDAIKVEEF